MINWVELMKALTSKQQARIFEKAQWCGSNTGLRVHTTFMLAEENYLILSFPPSQESRITRRDVSAIRISDGLEVTFHMAAVREAVKRESYRENHSYAAIMAISGEISVKWIEGASAYSEACDLVTYLPTYAFSDILHIVNRDAMTGLCKRLGEMLEEEKG